MVAFLAFLVACLPLMFVSFELLGAHGRDLGGYGRVLGALIVAKRILKIFRSPCASPKVRYFFYDQFCRFFHDWSDAKILEIKSETRTISALPVFRK